MIQQQLAINRQHINALHEAITVAKEMRTYFSTRQHTMLAEGCHREVVSLGKKVARLVAIQKQLKYDLQVAYITARMFQTLGLLD